MIFNEFILIEMNGTELKALRIKKGVSQQDVADATGIPQSTIGRIESGSTEVKKVSNLKKLNDYFKNELNDIKEYGSTDQRLEAEPLHLSENPESIEDRDAFFELPDGMISMRIPIVPVKAFAYGYLVGHTDPQYFEDFEMTTIEVTKRHKGHYLAFEVRGDSMTTLEPEFFRESIFDGVKVIARELPRHQWRSKLHTHKYDNWVIVHKEKGIVIKQIIDHDIINGIITIHSLNPDKKQYPDELFNLDDIEQIFNVVKKIDE